MKKYTKDLVAQLKQNGQDFEFYPTTDEMFDVIVNDLKIKEYNRFESVLDIGAGTAHFKDRLAEVKKNFTYFAIEKSEILIQNYSSDVVVIGTDFNETTLIDKKSDVEFCKAFNVEAGRILGWIRNKAEAKKELDGEKYFNVMNNSQLLLAFNR